MQTSLKKLPKSLVELTITLTADDVAVHREHALTELAHHVKVDGFRAGHAPKELIEERVGEEAITRETVDHSIRHAYAEAVTAEKLAVVSRPTVEVTSVEPLTFTATVAVVPEVKLGDYKSIKLKKESTKVEEKEVTDVISEFRRRHATAKVVERAAKKGDRVEIDFAGFTPDGVPLDGTVSKNHPLVLGEGNFIPGFEDGIIGMTVGSEKEHPVKFPSDYHAKHLADKDVKFKFTLHRVEELVEPPLDDAFAEKLEGKPAKWAEVEAKIREHVTKEKESAANAKLEDELIQALLKICTIDVPDALLDEEIDFMVGELKQKLTRGGLKFEDYLTRAGKDEAGIRAEMKPEAEKRVKVRFIINALIDAEKVEVTDAEFQKEVETIKAEYPAEQSAKIEKALTPLSSEGLRLKHQIKVIKLLKELTTTLAK